MGGRYEYFDLNNTKFGQPVFRGGLNYEISNGWNLRSSFGQGFRFPTMTELYFKGDIGPIGATGPAGADGADGADGATAETYTHLTIPTILHE